MIARALLVLASLGLALGCSSAPPPADVGRLGAACEEDAQCDEGLVCAELTATGGGQCTVACDATIEPCLELGGEVACTGPDGYCVLVCETDEECPDGTACGDAFLVPSCTR